MCKKAPSGNASTTWGKSLGPVPAAKGIGGAVNVPPKHKAYMLTMACPKKFKS